MRWMTTWLRLGRGIEAGRVWTNCYHAYPANTALEGYQRSAIGLERHPMRQDQHQQTKYLLVISSPNY